MQLAKFLLITGIIVLAIALYSLKVTLGQEELSGKLIVDFPKEEAKYTEQNDFSQSYGVRTTATVIGTLCGECIRDNQPSDCLVECGEVMVTY